MNDCIEKTVDLDAPVERVWHALVDYGDFGAWFRVALDQPFAVGASSTGHITHPGYEHVRWSVDVVAIEPMTRFAFRWHPYAIDPQVDYSSEPTTLVELLVEPLGNGARLRVIESGFDALPARRRAEAYRMNDGGWSQQMVNVAAHVGG